MSSISQHLDPARLADLARDPDYTPTMPKIADFFAEAQAKREAAQASAWENYQRALNAHREKFAQPDPDEPGNLNNCTSLLPLGDASVMVCYDTSGASIEVTGIDLDDGFVPAGVFAAEQVAEWEQAIRAELRDEAGQP